MQNLVNSATGFISDVAEGISQAPGKIMDIGNNLNDRLIDFAGDLERQKQETQSNVRDNLWDNKVRGTGMNVAGWFNNPLNIGIVVLAVIGILIAVRKS